MPLSEVQKLDFPDGAAGRGGASGVLTHRLVTRQNPQDMVNKAALDVKFSVVSVKLQEMSIKIEGATEEMY